MKITLEKIGFLTLSIGAIILTFEKKFIAIIIFILAVIIFIISMIKGKK